MHKQAKKKHIQGRTETDTNTRPIIRWRKLWQNYNLILNRGIEGFYMENELTHGETRERIILQNSFSPASVLSLSLSLHGFNRALSHTLPLTNAVSSFHWELSGIAWFCLSRQPKFKLKWRSWDTELCFEATGLVLCNCRTKYIGL